MENPSENKTNAPVLWLAPFKGITEKPYRNAFSRHFGGFDAMYAPFVSGVGNGRIHPSKLSDILPKKDNLTPPLPQLISTDAREIILFANTLQQQGYDHINWNLGCPFSRIANKKRGCGLLPYPDMLDKILEEVFREIKVKLSVKTRLGYAHPDEIHKVTEVLNRFPIDHVILHPRIGTQVYRGEVNLKGFAGSLKACRHFMVYNGDIYNLSRYRDLKERFPEITTWMLGRGALMSPFLPLQIKGITLSDTEKRKRLWAFHQELLEEGRGRISHPGKLSGSMKAIWYYMSGVFANGKEVFSRIKTTKTPEALNHAIEETLQQPFASDKEMGNYFKKDIRHVGRES